mmetsp:Transcript_8730/g.16537  ORF Transcript_8730/g.16537 Transcript_8730/m.16537 type:complete len:187 (+) Transcript_8730:60-620(+)
MDALARKLRRAELRKKRVISLDDDSGPAEKVAPVPTIQAVAKPTVPAGQSPTRLRSRSRRRRRRRDSSPEEVVKPPPKDLKPLGMGIGITSGGWGMGPVPDQPSELAGPTEERVCMRHLTGDCHMEDGQCPMIHPTTDEEIARWRKHFNRTPCKFGDQCYSSKCLFEHPNRPNWLGAIKGGPFTQI